MAIQTSTQTSWSADPHRAEQPEEEPGERLASWVIVYLAAFLTSLAVGGSAWAMGLVR